MSGSGFLASRTPLSIDEIYEAINKLAPEFEAEARKSEVERRPTEALADLMRRAKIPMAKLPKAVGGAEIRSSEQVDFFARLAYLNPTAGWLAFNQNGSLGLLGANASEDTLEKIFAEHPVPLLAAVSAPTGRTEKVEGGYRLNGRWSYASGITCADYVFLATLCDDPAGPLAAIVPTSEVTLHDNWHVAALQGTGSVDLTSENVFVPEDMTFSPFVQQRGGVMYGKIGYRGYVGGENFGFTLGVAQRMVEEITKLAKGKKRVLDPTTVGERGAFQQELGRTDATLRAARAYLMDELDRAEAIANDTDAPLAGADSARVEAAVGWATETVVKACTQLFPYAGAGALHLDSPIQRAFRDVIGSGQHIVATNETLDKWGQALMEGSD
jgi:alkylation response protein AidB-like acyl-CoA dehydrogenase